MLVSFRNYQPPERYDNTPWTQIKIEEATLEAGPYSLIQTIVISPVDPDPARPASRSFSTHNATLTSGWYRITFVDASNNQQPTDPLYHNPETEIMADLDDINSNLDGVAVQADSNNTALIQISVARVIRAYLAAVIDRTILFSWVNPDTTPDIVKTVAGMLIAAQLYVAKIGGQNAVLTNDHFAQRLYDRAMALLQKLVTGEVIIDGVTGTGTTASTEAMSELDFFPVDDTDRAFTMGMQL